MIAAGLLDISINLLLVLQVIVCLILGLLVLMQRPKNEGLGAAFGSGMTDSILGAGTTDVLQKGTVYFGIAFFVLTLGLSILIGHRNADPNLIGSTEAAPAIPTTEEIIDPEATAEEPAAEDLSKELEEVEKTAEPAAEESPIEETPVEEPAAPAEEPVVAPVVSEVSEPIPAAPAAEPAAVEEPAKQ